MNSDFKVNSFRLAFDHDDIMQRDSITIQILYELLNAARKLKFLGRCRRLVIKGNLNAAMQKR